MPFSRSLFLLTILAATLPLRASDLPDGYRLAQNYRVDSCHAQLRLQLLLDSHITDDLLADWWLSGRDLPLPNGVCEELGIKLHPALVRLLDRDDQIVASRTCERVLAKLAPCVSLTAPPQPAFTLTVDYGEGYSVFLGPITFFLLPDDTTLGWQTATAGGKLTDLSISNSARTAWQLLPSPRGCDIVEVTCYTFIDTLENVHFARTPHYTVEIRRFRRDGSIWLCASTKRYGYIVNYDDDPSRWLKKILAEMKDG